MIYLTSGCWILHKAPTDYFCNILSRKSTSIVKVVLDLQKINSEVFLKITYANTVALQDSWLKSIQNTFFLIQLTFHHGQFSEVADHWWSLHQARLISKLFVPNNLYMSLIIQNKNLRYFKEYIITYMYTKIALHAKIYSLPNSGGILKPLMTFANN